MKSNEKPGQCLVLPPDVQADNDSFELVSVWFSKGKAKVLTRADTGLDDRIDIWAEIVAGIVENIADHVAARTTDEPFSVEQAIANSVATYFRRKSG